jgi:hypothetical protein
LSARIRKRIDGVEHARREGAVGHGLWGYFSGLCGEILEDGWAGTWEFGRKGGTRADGISIVPIRASVR